MKEDELKNNQNQFAKKDENVKEEIQEVVTNEINNDENNTQEEITIVEEQTKKKKFLIFNYSIWRLLAYFVIYSIIGFLVETIFCLVRYGVFESRQSFLYGPFCSIYGLGAIFIIITLQYLNKNYNTLFIGGCILGLALEYFISWIGEVIFNIRWWDYSNQPFNLNGRICLLYGLFWGFLSLYLMISLNPRVDRLINWIKKKIGEKASKIILIASIIFILFDCIVTAGSVTCFMVRTITENDIQIANKESVDYLYEKIYSNENIANFIDKYWGDYKMIRTFPQLRVEGADGKLIYLKDYYPDIQPYYMKFDR